MNKETPCFDISEAETGPVEPGAPVAPDAAVPDAAAPEGPQTGERYGLPGFTLVELPPLDRDQQKRAMEEAGSHYNVGQKPLVRVLDPGIIETTTTVLAGGKVVQVGSNNSARIGRRSKNNTHY